LFRAGKIHSRASGAAVKQSSVFTPNRLGWLHELINLLDSHQVHVLALTLLDTTDRTIAPSSVS
jgi:hypothetical protein